VNPNGYILTNDLVMSGPSAIEALTQDKKNFKAHMIGHAATDPSRKKEIACIQ
jgi:S1-C subfamily serine protease